MVIGVRTIRRMAHEFLHTQTGFSANRTDNDKQNYLQGLSDAFDALGLPHERIEAVDAAESVLFPDDPDVTGVDPN